MKYFSTKNIWNKEKEHYIRLHYTSKNNNGDYDNRVFSIKKMWVDGKFDIAFREECDQFFTCQVTKEEAVEMLQEAIDWIKE